MRTAVSISVSQSDKNCVRPLTGAAGLGVWDVFFLSGEGYLRRGWCCLSFSARASAFSLPGMPWCNGDQAHLIKCCAMSMASSRAAHRSELGTGPVDRHHGVAAMYRPCWPRHPAHKYSPQKLLSFVRLSPLPRLPLSTPPCCWFAFRVCPAGRRIPTAPSGNCQNPPPNRPWGSMWPNHQNERCAIPLQGKLVGCQ